MASYLASAVIRRRIGAAAAGSAPVVVWSPPLMVLLAAGLLLVPLAVLEVLATRRQDAPRSSPEVTPDRAAVT
jgi:hypothetical protein